ncbi:LOW QUALITY PROTEIN: putative bromodomain-containing protein 10 [Eudromia elegans]
MDLAQPVGAVEQPLPFVPVREVSEDPSLFSGPPEREEDQYEDADAGVENSSCPWEQTLSPELQQGYRILCEFLLEKHRPLTAPFLKPLMDQASIRDGGAASQSVYNSNHSFQQSSAGMWLLKMEEKFSSGQYTGITDFVADFLMLEMCYQLHGVDHWLSKQAQKLEMMLEQKLALLSRLLEASKSAQLSVEHLLNHLRAKTRIAVTSRRCYGLEDEKEAVYTSTRCHSAPHTLVGLTTDVFESITVQLLRQEEYLKTKEEKRLREQERKGEAVCWKEMEEWEKTLLAQAAPTRMETMWEIPAIGHFLCLAQQILNLPEIVFYELERCLLMPQCNTFLSKIMTSLLSPPHCRSTLHQKTTLSYGTWEAALRQKVQQWYTVVGQTDNPSGCAEKLGLSPQFFEVLGEVNPLEEKPFHELPFQQKVWLLKGLCDFVYETQKDVQDAVLGQPIHECREVILGYDYFENAYVHFPQFCGADVRIYKQKPFQAPKFPSPVIKVKRVPRIKLEKAKCEHINKSNGEDASDGKELLPCTNTEPGKSFNCSVCYPGKKNHLGSFSMTSEEIKLNCEIKAQRVCDMKKAGCWKENLEKTIIPGEIIGFGELVGTGDVRAIENGENCEEASIVNTVPSLLKANTLKTCQMHVNGNPEMICHKTAEETMSENSLQNNKQLKLTKMLAKKKKKKKKLKDNLNENLWRKLDDLQRKCEIDPHPFKSFKPEIQSKLFTIKKTTKQKHKSGKKSMSNKAIKKKRKAVAQSTVPEFQLICTNLDELRELIKKIENELVDLEDMKKKSGRWYYRKQAVKELHSTLIRLLNELLPWELKLMKAFQRNRSRLKKDYEDFQRQIDHDKFTRELWRNDKSEGDADPFEVISSKSSESAEHEDVSKKDHPDLNEVKLIEVILPAGKGRPLKKKMTSKEIHKTLTKSFKRQSKQNHCLDDSTDELSPRKKAKLSTTEALVQSSERGMQTDSCLTELKQHEQAAPESFSLSDPATSISNFLIGTKPIQALLAKSIGNKVTLTNQLPPTLDINTSEKTIISPMESLPIKPAMPCQTSSRNLLQTAYKMPSSHYVPIDLHNSSVKIEMQHVIDPKTGEKVMQSKNCLIQQIEGKITSIQDIKSLKPKSPKLHCTTFSQAAIVNVSLTPVLITPTAHATNQLPSTIFNKNIMHLSQLTSPVNKLHPLYSITSTSNLLSSSITVSHSKTDKTKSAVSATTFPISLALPALPTAIQAITSATTLSESTNSTSSFNSLTSKENSDSSEAKQELKTVCVRESQSILVTTRGGNTGIVKVQTNPDQITPNSLSPSSFFAYTPQLQALLVPKSTTLSTSTLSSIATATSGFPLFEQSSVSGFATSTAISVNITAFPDDLNQIKGKKIKHTLGQLPCGGILDQIEKTCLVSSPTFLSPLSSTSTLMSEIPSSPVNAISVGQNNTGITPNSSIEQQANTKHPLIQSETSTAKNGDVISGTPIQKVMLVINPPILSPCGATRVNIIPSPTSTGVSDQKLLFINTPLPCGASSLVVESSKQSLPSSLNKAFASATKQPQLVLIPSTVEVPIKKNPSPNVSQVKDVKIGLNIGQAFVNTKGNEQQAPVNILQSVISKGEDKKRIGFTLCLSSSDSLIPVCSSFAHQSVTSLNESIGIITKAATAFTVTAANACLESVSVTSRETSVGTQPTVLIGGNNTSRIRPVLAKQLCKLNIGNTVDISTIETRYASSVLISTTQPTMSPQKLSSILEFPAISLPGSTTSSKVIHTVPHFTAVPALPSLPKDQPHTLLQFQSPGISTAVITNADNHKPQTVLSSTSQNTGKVISFPNFSSIQCQQMSPNIVKQSHTYTCSSGIQMDTTSPTVKSQAGDQLNEPCMQQKIVINTCMPLAPGTEIMINGTHFIVPPQGLGPGSHVLLLSSSAKQTPLPSAINHGQGVQGVPIVNPVPPNITLASTNSLSWQMSKQPLKSSTRIVNSSGSANALPTVHAVPHILNTHANACASLSTTQSTSSVIKPPANVLVATSLISAMHPGNCQLSSNTSVFGLDTSIKKLLVSPEGAILNAFNISASKVLSLPPVVVSTNRNPITVFTPFQSSCLDKPDKAVS